MPLAHSPVSRRIARVPIVLALALTLSVITLGYIMLGVIPMILFALGYLGGFIFWLLKPSSASFRDIAAPYFVTLAIFILHKYEERTAEFFPALSNLTGTPMPDSGSALAILLYALAAAWLLVPWLMVRRRQLGYFLAWSFFMAMGVTELAHFVFPLFAGGPYAYFPGMWSVIPLAPAAWWGLRNLVCSHSAEGATLR